MCPQQEVTRVDEFAVVLILDVDDAPSVLAAADLLAIDDDALLGANDSEGNVVLVDIRSVFVREAKGKRLTRILSLSWISSSSVSSVSKG